LIFSLNAAWYTILPSFAFPASKEFSKIKSMCREGEILT
jgi:hypothetical protein